MENFLEAIKAKQDYLTLLEKEEAVAIHVGEDILPLQAPVLSDGALRLVRRELYWVNASLRDPPCS